MFIRRVLFVFVAFVGFAAPAHAQFTAYGTFAPLRVGGLAVGPTAYSQESFWGAGFGVGGSANVLPLGVAALAIDFRINSCYGVKAADTYLAGVKVGIKAPLAPFKAYVEAAGGFMRTRGTTTTGNFATNDFAAYEIIAGVDHPIGPHLDWRIAEVSGGRGISTSASNLPNINIFTFGTGLAVHF